MLCRVESTHGETVAALEYFRLAIQCHHESGNFMISTPLAALATLFDRLERYEPLAILAGYAFGPITAASCPELSATIAHLREVLGDQAYETLAHRGALLTTADMANYAYDQIDQARAELNASRNRAHMRTSRRAVVALSFATERRELVGWATVFVAGEPRVGATAG